MVLENRTPAGFGALAAALLAESCHTTRGENPSLGIVCDLALDLERRLAALSRSDSGAGEPPDSLIEAALACADLATLAACNRSALPKTGEPLAVAATHLAAGAARALVALAESRAGALDLTHAENVLRDARGARWRTDLAVRQVDETSHGGGEAG